MITPHLITKKFAGMHLKQFFIIPLPHYGNGICKWHNSRPSSLWFWQSAILHFSESNPPCASMQRYCLAAWSFLSEG